MPTENRSSNTDPRDVFIRLNPLGLGEEELRKDSSGFEDQRTHSDYLLFLAGYRETHAEPQHHPEPIAWMVGTAFWWTREEAERDAADTGLPIVGLGPMTGSVPAELHQGDAIGTLVRDYNERIVFTPIGDPHIIDDMKVYAHADPAEVERLRDELEIVKNNDLKWRGLREQEAEIENLRTQLAERDALLREALPAVEYESGRGDAAGTSYLQLADKIKSLSASAEPSAPVEIDERADFERHVILTTGRPIDSELKRHPVRHDEYECRTMQTRWNDWQARAALDRKPS
ncbi:hypothetical protein [Pseudomonas guariconensis]|uniref:hypothetical protein n=1 Tax=Pseudomonas guariconensis TaxID=1288410 RepID=UPI0018A959E2|nr:hypothetical protein [Pseudomonas guariconensis]MBF8720453.1 hypothetical protein [Pseudomonas guariconensis]